MRKNKKFIDPRYFMDEKMELNEDPDDYIQDYDDIDAQEYEEFQVNQAAAEAAPKPERPPMDDKTYNRIRDLLATLPDPQDRDGRPLALTMATQKEIGNEDWKYAVDNMYDAILEQIYLLWNR